MAKRCIPSVNALTTDLIWYQIDIFSVALVLTLLKGILLKLMSLKLIRRSRCVYFTDRAGSYMLLIVLHIPLIRILTRDLLMKLQYSLLAPRDLPRWHLL